MYKNYIFDLFGTIIRDTKQFPYYGNIIKPIYSKVDEFLCVTDFSSKQACLKGINSRFNLGWDKKQEEEFIIAAKKWSTSMEFIPDIIKVLTALKKDGSKLALLTNTHILEIDIYDKLDIGKYFDIVIMSHKIGIAKPDPKIFNIALQKLGSSSKDTMMIGDNLEKDIIGAEKVGVNALLFDIKQRHPDYKNSIISWKEFIDRGYG